jgi:enolase-phosphatase E1
VTASQIKNPVILLDIEGTTTPIDFVYRTLFPYARAHVKSFFIENLSSEETQADIAGLRKEHREDTRQGLDPPSLQEQPEEARLESLAAYIHWLMDQDRKSTPLKSLQGKIWKAGYLSGELQSKVFDDVPRAFARWREQQIDICIYSSGSVLAQKLLFAHTEAGDLTTFIRDFFDTETGAKREAESYQRIASSLGRESSDITFISDSIAELDAAQSAGLRAFLCVRPGNHPQQGSSHRAVQTFDVIFPSRS